VYNVSKVSKSGWDMPDTLSLSLRVDRAKAEKLDELARATDRSRSWLLEKALDAYLADQAWQVEQIHQGLGDVAAGRTHQWGEVREWLGSWGNEEKDDLDKNIK
jgi:RHH-type rel operon transcriptional repressor/antitoxin RelB